MYGEKNQKQKKLKTKMAYRKTAKAASGKENGRQENEKVLGAWPKNQNKKKLKTKMAYYETARAASGKEEGGKEDGGKRK